MIEEDRRGGTPKGVRPRRDPTAASFDHLTVRKLITAVARNDRFNEGAWEGFLSDGEGPQLFTRLLELEEDLAARR